MRTSKFSEEQVIGFLRQAEAGMPIKELCRKHGFSDASFYKWRARFGGMDVNEAKRLRELELENDTSNRHLARVQVMPQSSNIERIYPSETTVTIAGQRSKVMADQIMTADKRRLKTSMGRLSQADMLAVERVIRLQLGLG